jgi:hypothetical protein
VEESTLQRKIRERREKLAAEEAAKKAAADPSAGIEFDEDLIPEMEETGISEEESALDAFLKSLPIATAYETWCGKSKIKYPLKKEGNMISCPVPEHPDKNPSAWFNTEKNTWHCAACDQGGDQFTIAEFKFGYRHDSTDFPKLKRAMAESLGWKFFTKGVGKDKHTVAVPPEEEEEKPVGHSFSTPALAPVPDLEPEPAPAKVVSIAPDTTEEVKYPVMPEWELIYPKDTFLDIYVRLTTVDTIPEAYHFWSGMVALGLAMGRDLMFADYPPVGGNLFVCLVGDSGTGKSRALMPLEDLLDTAMPFHYEDPDTRGIKIVGDAGSPERIVEEFQRRIPSDPSDPKSPVRNFPTKGLITFGEMSSIAAKAGRRGTDLKERLMQFCDLKRKVTASASGNDREAYLPFASGITTTQPETIRRQVTAGDLDSGFANRWLFIAGQAKPAKPFGQIIPDMGEAVLPLQRVMSWASTERLIQLDDEAQEAYEEFFYSVIDRDKKTSRDGDDLLVRVDLTFKKIMLLLAANKMEEKISLATVESAKHLYRFILECWEFIGRRIGVTDRSDIFDKVHALFQKKLNLNMREIKQGLPTKYRKNNEGIIQAIDDMKRAGLIVEEEPPLVAGKKGRKPSVRWQYVA